MKIDLHIHSPASKCFKDHSSADIAAKMVQKALYEDLKIIGLTDHHTVNFIPNIQKAAEKTSLIVLPGIELSFNVEDLKNVYLLAFFPENTSRPELNQMLDTWKIPDSAKGDCHYRMEVEIGKVIREVRQCGGILISGHVDKDETRKHAIPILINNYGIELFDFKYSDTFEEIQKQFTRSICGFTFSDSHQIANIGSRYSEIDLEEYYQLRKLIKHEN